MTAPEAIDSLDAVSRGYKAIFCDVWGVIHDGVRKHPAAEDALRAARRAGCKVVLLTNSPRPQDGVARQLDGLGFAREAYDTIVTSGDVTRSLIAQGPARLFHIGPGRNEDLFAGLDVDFVGEEAAEAVVVTGLFDDETETPADYAAQLVRLRERGLAMVCANPDVVVHRGEALIFCAGAIARDYEALGGAVAMAGKPYRPIYDLAAERVGVAGPREVLAIGDGLNTDIRGANGYGVDVLLIVDGVHRDDLAGSSLGDALKGHGLSARYALSTLR